MSLEFVFYGFDNIEGVLMEFFISIPSTGRDCAKPLT